MSAEKVIPECECVECLCKVCKDKDDTNAPQRDCDEVSPVIPESSESKVGDAEKHLPEGDAEKHLPEGDAENHPSEGDAENHPLDCDCADCLCKPCGSFLPNPPETLPPECDCSPCYCDPCGECVGKGGDAAGEVSLKKSHQPNCTCADCLCDPCDPTSQAQKIHSPSCDCAICSCVRSAEKNKEIAALHPEDCDCQICKCGPCDSFTPNPPEKLPAECDCAPCYCDPCGECVGKAGDAAEVSLKRRLPPDCNCADCLCISRKSDLPTPQKIHSPTPQKILSPTPQKIYSPSDAAQVSLKKQHSPDCDCADCLCIPCDSDLPTPQKIHRRSDAVQSYLKKWHPPDCDCVNCLNKSCEPHIPTPQKIHSPSCDCVTCYCAPCVEEKKVHPEGCDCQTCKCCSCGVKPAESAEKPHPEDCECVDCICEKAKVQEAAAEKPHPEDCNCADCICEKDKIQETAEKAHAEDCDCADCICEMCKVQEATAEKPHPEDCNCVECICEKGIKTDTTEIVKLQEVENEALCSCDEAEIQAANAKEPPLLNATLSGLKLAVQCVKKKCKQRDCMIAALIKELELKSESHVFDTMLHELAMANTTDINFQRPEIFNSLESFGCQPCEHPEYPNCPCAKALTCSHPNYPNCPCGTDQAMYLLRFPTGNKRKSLASNEEPALSACPCPDEEIELESEFLCGKGSQTCTHDNFPNCPCVKTKKAKQPQTSLPCSSKNDVKKITSTIPFRNTVSGLQLSLENAQEKCKLKDFIIAVMINELETRSKKKLPECMLRKLATAISHTDLDFDRTQVCNILKRPQVKPSRGCTHPKHPDNCPCGAHDIKQAQSSPQCPRPDGTCPCSSQKPKRPSSSCTCKSKKCPCK